MCADEWMLSAALIRDQRRVGLPRPLLAAGLV